MDQPLPFLSFAGGQPERESQREFDKSESAINRSLRAKNNIRPASSPPNLKEFAGSVLQILLTEPTVGRCTVSRSLSPGYCAAIGGREEACVPATTPQLGDSVAYKDRHRSRELLPTGVLSALFAGEWAKRTLALLFLYSVDQTSPEAGT